MNGKPQSALSVLMAALILSTSVIGFINVSTQPAAADIGEYGCHDDTIGLVTGDIGTVVYSNLRDPCWGNENITDVDTEPEAERRIAQLALEDRRFAEQYFDTFDQQANKIEGPAYLDGKNAFINASRNGASEAAAITEARQAVHTRTAAQQEALWLEYKSMLNSLANLEAQAVDKQVRNDSFRIGVYNTSSMSVEDGYRLRNYTEKGATVNVTLTNGEYVEVPAPYKTDGNGNVTEKLHPVKDNVIVEVYNPENGKWESIVNTVERSYPSVQEDVSPGASITTQKDRESVKLVYNRTVGAGSFGISIDGTDYNLRQSDQNHNYNMRLRDGTGSGSMMHEWTVGNHDNTTVYLNETGDGNLTVNVPSYGGKYTTSTTQTLSVDDITVKAWGHDPPTASEMELIKYAPGSDAAGIVDSYTARYLNKHQRIETADNNVIDALGNSSSGYLSDVERNVDLGNINYSEVYTPYEKYRMTVEPSDVGEQSWLAYQHAQLGYGGADLNSTVTLKVMKGATVDGETISSNMTLEGELFTASQPPNGTWQTGTNYTVGSSGDDVSSAVYMMRTVTESYTENGTIHYRTEGVTTSVSNGTVKVVNIQNSDGETLDTVDHTDRSPTSTNVSEFTSQINSLQDQLRELRDEIDEDNDGNSPDGGVGGADGGSGDNISFDLGALGELKLPFESMSFSYVGLGLIAVAGAYILLQMGLSTFLLRLFGGGK